MTIRTQHLPFGAHEDVNKSLESLMYKNPVSVFL